MIASHNKYPTQITFFSQMPSNQGGELSHDKGIMLFHLLLT